MLQVNDNKARAIHRYLPKLAVKVKSKSVSVVQTNFFIKFEQISSNYMKIKTYLYSTKKTLEQRS